MLARLSHLGQLFRFVQNLALRAVTPPWAARDIQAYAVRLTRLCAPPIVAVIWPFGMVLALQGLAIFELFGAQRLLSSLVSVAVIRELAPVLASVLLAAQGGSTIAAELGAMAIREELDATRVMAIDAVRAHAVPRALGMLIAAPLLQLIAMASGIGGGWLVAVVLRGESNAIWWANLWALTSAWDVVGATLKTMVFAVIIGASATWHGFQTHGGAAGVGRSVNDTVVSSITLCIVANYFLTSAFFSVHP